jgi:hypothetical protein
MHSWISRLRLGTIVLAGTLCLGSIGVGPASARRRSFAERHPILTGVAAGAAVHHMAKHSGRSRRMRGGHRNFAQRHPVLTGVAAGAATHHYMKKHR